MLLLLLNNVVLMALWKIDVHLISTLVNKGLYYYYYNMMVVVHQEYTSINQLFSIIYIRYCTIRNY